MKDKVEVIWFNDLTGFMDQSKVANIIPDANMTFEEQLNALVRFSVYFSILVFVIKHDVRVIYFAIFIAFMTILMYNSHMADDRKRTKIVEKLSLSAPSKSTGERCVRPTRTNPYMNVTFNDLEKFPNRPKACNLNNSSVSQTVQKYVNEDMYNVKDDIGHIRGSDRQFYTTPNTTIPNSQNEFAHWLYNIGKTCKEDSIKCSR